MRADAHCAQDSLVKLVCKTPSRPNGPARFVSLPEFSHLCGMEGCGWLSTGERHHQPEDNHRDQRERGVD